MFLILSHNIEDSLDNEVEKILLSIVITQTHDSDKKRKQEVKSTLQKKLLIEKQRKSACILI